MGEMLEDLAADYRVKRVVWIGNQIGFNITWVEDHTLAVSVWMCLGLIRDIKGVTLVAKLSQK
jgi:hypothetical protein